jgi:hypothetical protein
MRKDGIHTPSIKYKITVLPFPLRSGKGTVSHHDIDDRKEIAYGKDSSEFRGQHHITFRLQLAGEESLLTVQLI